MTNSNNTNSTSNTTGTNSSELTQGQANNGGSNVGGLSRELLAQQAEILLKIEAILEGQIRIETALAGVGLANQNNSQRSNSQAGVTNN